MNLSPDLLAGAVLTSGLVSGVIVAVAARRPREGLRCLVDFLLAASLVRLTGPATWTAILLAVVTIFVRQVVGQALRRASTSRVAASADDVGR